MPRSRKSGTRLVSRLTTAVVSLATLFAIGTYLVTPTSTVLALTVASPAALRVPAGHEVVSVTARDSSGRPLVGARVQVGQTRHGSFKVLASFQTGARGVARQLVALAKGSYVVRVISRQGGTTLTGQMVVNLRPRRAYVLTVRAVRTGALTVVPVRGY